jgi:uncharacterized Fe-S cluster protein YjdI/CDGSH-type Zn-finger protein
LFVTFVGKTFFTRFLMEGHSRMRRERVIRYTGEKIIVKFHVDRCTHVAECLMGLPDVFDTHKRPWIRPDEARADEVAEVVMRCPTGALHFQRKDGGPEEAPARTNALVIEENGPIYAKGDVEVRSSEGEVILRDTRLAFCRCGASKHMPLCDNRHSLVDYEDGRMESPDTFTGGAGQAVSGKLTVTPAVDGPLHLSGPVEIFDSNGIIGFRGTRCAICRCGATKKSPFCDGSHTAKNFKAP